MTPKPIVRLYKIADAYVIEFIKTLRTFFIADQAEFVNEDSNYASPTFEDDWETAIVAAENEPTAEQREDQLMQLTETVNTEMEVCRDVFQSAKRYIKKAFPNSTAHWNEFGLDDYDKARQTQPKMIKFMKLLHNTAVKYTAELTAPAVNFSQARIDEIKVAHDNLDKANNNQETFKKNMLTHTENRVKLHNAAWLIATDVAEVGKLLFKDQYAKYQHYLLPASEETTVMLLSGIITDSVSGDPLVEVEVELVEHGLQTESDSLGAYGFGNPPAGNATLRISLAGYQEQNISVIITDNEALVVNVQLVPMI
jgi:hypothetical protein